MKLTVVCGHICNECSSCWGHADPLGGARHYCTERRCDCPAGVRQPPRCDWTCYTPCAEHADADAINGRHPDGTARCRTKHCNASPRSGAAWCAACSGTYTIEQSVEAIDEVAASLMGTRPSARDTERLNDAALRLSSVIVKCGLYASSHTTAELEPEAQACPCGSGRRGDGHVCQVSDAPGPLATREAQLDVHDRHATAAYSVLLAIMQRPETAERVVALSRERLVGIGFDQYGDAMFRQTFPELLQETDEELADAVNRVIAGLERLASNVHASALELLTRA